MARIKERYYERHLRKKFRCPVVAFDWSPGPSTPAEAIEGRDPEYTIATVAAVLRVLRRSPDLGCIVDTYRRRVVAVWCHSGKVSRVMFAKIRAILGPPLGPGVRSFFDHATSDRLPARFDERAASRARGAARRDPALGGGLGRRGFGVA